MTSLGLYLISGLLGTLEVNQTARVRVRVEAEDVRSAVVFFHYEPGHLVLLEGGESEPLGDGTFVKEVEWFIQAIAETPREATWVTVTAMEEVNRQLVTVPVVVGPGG